MIELLDEAVIGSITAAVAYVLGRRQRRRVPRAPAAVCSCTHGYGEHDDTGRCKHVDKERMLVRDKSTYVKNEYGTSSLLSQADQEWSIVEEPCRCQRYSGPVPVDLYYAAPPALS